MSMNRKSNRALSSLHTVAAAQAPVVRHLVDGVIRRAARGNRNAIEQLAREFRTQMVDHAEQHLARFDMDAEDVVQNVFLALLEQALVEPPRAVCAVQWLLDRVALFASRTSSPERNGERS
jgi:hypothetical protein